MSAREEKPRARSVVDCHALHRHCVVDLNEDLRRKARGGIVCITPGVRDLGPNEVAAILAAVRASDTCTLDNDPCSERDLVVLKLDGLRVMWKIDYYDLTRRYASPDPSNADVTCRVMTVMLASEY